MRFADLRFVFTALPGGSTSMAENAAGEVGAEVSVEIAGRLRALNWSVSELSRRSQVSREVISGLLNGRRLPSLSTYERLRRTLGLLPSPALLTRPAAPADVSDEHLSRLAARVGTGRSVLLADLSDATGVAIAAVRESLPKVQERLRPVGLRLVTDGDEVTVMPQAHCAEALERLGQVTVDRELTQEALEALGAVALHTEATRDQVEVARGGVDCASLLRRLTERGYLQAAFAESGRGRPLRYRLTTRAVSVARLLLLGGGTAVVCHLAGGCRRQRRRAGCEAFRGAAGSVSEGDDSLVGVTEGSGVPSVPEGPCALPRGRSQR
jgi:chromosome segregation and condensation protein ScpB